MSGLFNKLALPAGALAAVVAMSACGDSSAGLEANAQASLSFAATGGQSPQGTPTPPQNPILIAGHTIVVSSVELNLSELEVEGLNDTKMEMKGGITVVALPMSGSIVTPVTANLAAGTYDEFEMDVHSVRIKGTYDGQPFDVTATVNEELEVAIQPPLVVTQSGTANLTVVVQIASWFRSADGSAIDLVNMNSTLQSRLASNIEASFDAFEDDDRDGHDD